MKKIQMLVTEQEQREIIRKRKMLTESEKRRMQKLAGIIKEDQEGNGESGLPTKEVQFDNLQVGKYYFMDEEELDLVKFLGYKNIDGKKTAVCKQIITLNNVPDDESKKLFYITKGEGYDHMLEVDGPKAINFLKPQIDSEEDSSPYTSL